MTYESLVLPGKEKLREMILDLYSRDIAESSVHFSTRNYAFCFSQGCFPVAIRVGFGKEKTRKTVMSELMFVDYVKLSAPTVSEPIPSNNGNIVEEIDMGGNHYCITMFRKANGDVLPTEYWDNAYFERVGRVLGKIHKASYEAGQQGFRFKRPQWYEVLPQDYHIYDDKIGKEVADKCNEVLAKIKALPQTPETFGMIHGDFAMTNIFSEWDNVWIFDFDDCCYGHYITDISFALFQLLGNTQYKSLYTHKENRFHAHGLCAYLRKGYEEEFTLAEDQWDLIEDFYALRCIEIIVMMTSSSFPQEIIDEYLNPIIGVLMNMDRFYEMMDSDNSE